MRTFKLKNYNLPTHYTLPNSISVVIDKSLSNIYGVKTQPTIASVADLTPTQSNLVHLRDG
jgi:hypothetical protein